MPKNLTDTRRWETVAVPVGTDPATAGSMETPLQLLTDRTAVLANRLLSLCVLNLAELDTSGADSGSGIVVGGDMVYDPETGSMLDVSTTAAGAGQENHVVDGEGWQGGTAPTLAAGADPRLATDGQGNFVCTTALLHPSAVSMLYRDGLSGAWAVPAAWGGPGHGPDGQFSAIACKRSGVGPWVAGDINTFFFRVCSGSGFAWSVPTADPGFAAGAMCIEHSDHPAAKLYPADPGNQHFIALTPTERSRSSDGYTWTAAASHGLGATPLSAAYSAQGERWIAVLRATGTGLLAGLGVSDDSGATWSAMSGTPIDTALGAITDARIASDGRGCWMVALTDGSAVEVWASWDNGETWTEAHVTATPGSGILPYATRIALAYGGGRFHLMTDDGSGNIVAFATLRADE